MSKCYRITDPSMHDEIRAYAYDKNEAKSFCLINNMEWEKIKEEDAENDPDFPQLLLSELCGILLPQYLISKMMLDLRDLIYPLKITEGVLISIKKNCTSEEKKSINLAIEIVKKQQIEILQSTITSLTYEDLYYDDKEFNMDWLFD